MQLRTAENLIVLDPDNSVAIAALALTQKKTEQKKTERTRRRHKTKSTQTPDLVQDLHRFIAALEQKLSIAKDPTHQRRIACRLGTLQPGHPQAIDCLLQLLLSQKSPALYKRVVEDLKEVLLDDQLAAVVCRVKGLIANANLSTSPRDDAAQLQEGYKLLWYCAQRMSYANFSQAWDCYSDG